MSGCSPIRPLRQKQSNREREPSACFESSRYTNQLELERAAKAEGIGLFAHGPDAEGDVVFERNAEFGSALDDIPDPKYSWRDAHRCRR